MADSITNMANDPKRKAKSNDIGWRYAFWPDLTNKDLVQCTLCGKKCHSGIKRLKQHLAGNSKDVAKCPHTTTEIMRQMQQALATTRRKKPLECDKNASIAASNTVPTLQQKTISEEDVQEQHSGQPSQTSSEKPLEEQKVHMDIANFLYGNGIPLNVVNSKSYRLMVESICQYGSGLKPPSSNELRVPLLEDAKMKTDELRRQHEAAWKEFGCTLMSDRWTDRSGRHLINFLVNSPKGTYFMDSIDASSQCHDAEMLAKLWDEKIEEIGSDNVIQVVTHNGSYSKAVGEILTRKRPTLFWTPCAAHCIDLMLEDIGHLKDFKTTITNAKKITTFIYRHRSLLDAMKEKTNGRDLVRPAVTRFATTFITLQSLYKHKDVLRYLFIIDDWSKSKLSTTQAGKIVSELVSSTKFWTGVEYCIRASQPLIAVMRIVYGEEKPAMPEACASMEHARQKIKNFFDNKSRRYKKVIDIVERRWATQLEQKLYGAALFLNPAKYFDLKERDPDISYKLRDDFNDVLEKMVRDEAILAKISNQVDSYDEQRDNFGRDMAIDQRKLKTPLNWWRSFGGGSIELAKFARRIIGLCCSSFGCDRNWSNFEFNHTKKINQLEHKRSKDLVCIQYNQKLASRSQERDESGRKFDPLALDDFDWSNEWINNEGEVGIGKSNAYRGHCAFITYSRRGSTSKGTTLVYSDSSEDISEYEETLLPNDDEDVDDDYGQKTPTPSSDDDCHEGCTNALVLDDYEF